MQTASIKTVLSLIFACMLLMLTINYILKKSIVKNEITNTTVETKNEIANKQITLDASNISDTLDTLDKNTETEIKVGAEIEAEVKTEVEVKTEPFFYLNDYERWIAECVVMGESGGESYEGQVLVAQCLLNACLKDDIQPSKVRTRYKYSGWNENPTDSVKNAVKAVFDDGFKITDEFILYFYAPKYVKSKWHESQRFVTEVGNHRFFAEWN